LAIPGVVVVPGLLPPGSIGVVHQDVKVASSNATGTPTAAQSVADGRLDGNNNAAEVTM